MQAVLRHERKRLSVEHSIRTGLFQQPLDDQAPIVAGGEIVLTDRVLERALSEFVRDSTVTATESISDWAPVSLARRPVAGVELYFPLHDEHFCRAFMGRVDSKMKIGPYLWRNLGSLAHSDIVSEQSIDSQLCYGEISHHFGEEIGAYFAFMQVVRRPSRTALALTDGPAPRPLTRSPHGSIHLRPGNPQRSTTTTRASR